MKKKSIMEMDRGKIVARVDYELGRILENIMDPNTPAEASRKITLTLTLTPDKERSFIGVKAVVKSSLAPTNPSVTAIVMDADENGELTAVELLPEIPGQTSMDDEAQIIRIVR